MTSALEYYYSTAYPNWHEDAACVDLPQEWFFGEVPTQEDDESPKRHRPKLNMTEVRRAQRICADCPVQAICLKFALENHEEFGIWGGSTGRERRKWWQEHERIIGEQIDTEDEITMDGEAFVEAYADEEPSECDTRWMSDVLTEISATECRS